MIFNLLGVVISDLVFVLFCLNVFLKGDFVDMVNGYIWKCKFVLFIVYLLIC